MPNGADRPGARPQRGPQRPSQGGRGDGPRQGGGPPPRWDNLQPIDTSKILLKAPAADLFDGVAHEAAKTVALDDRGREKKENKPSQIRKFFDELVMWDAKVNGIQDLEARRSRFTAHLPFIRMMNAKVAYAKGRQLLDDHFQKLFSDGLKQVEDPATLRNFKLFFEAFLGFYKVYRRSDK
jgi:CRISPR-associated protein Csm2